MASHRFELDIAAPIEMVFDLWTNLERAPEWIGGMSRVTDVTGPIDQAGTRYVAWFGRMRSPSEVVEAERPHVFRTRFGNWLLRGENGVTLEPNATGTHLAQWFRTQGVVPAIMAWIWSKGSYTGSFRGELEAFARIVEREAAAVREDQPSDGQTADAST